MKKLLILGLLLTTIQLNHFAQDLIERTLQNTYLTKKENSPKNRLAQLVEQNRVAYKTTSTRLFKVTPKVNAKTEQYVSSSINLNVELSAIQNLLKQKQDFLTVQIPVSESQFFELELVKSNIRATGYRLRTSNFGASNHPSQEMLFYKGIIKNDNNSLAAVTISEDAIRMMISDKAGNYIVGKMPNASTEYILYNDQKRKQAFNFECTTPPEIDATSVNIDNTGGVIVNGQCVPVYIEADYDFYLNNGSNVAQVERYLNALFNEVETVYFNENIGVVISEIFVHTSPDPFINTVNTEQALNLFRSLRQNNFNGRLAHLISGRQLGGGRASIDVLCSINANHAVSQLFSNFNTFPGYSWDLYVFSHEMGHNFGSRHTHACVWNGNNTSIDGCAGFTEGNCALQAIPSDGGTVMSYCHQSNVSINFTKGFGPQPGDVLRNRFNNSTCNLQCDDACNLVGQPCDDGNPNTINDQYDENCICIGVIVQPQNCTTPINVALNKAVTQDGTQNNQFATYAVDGNTVGEWNAQTQTDWKLNAWWEVDLQQAYDISTINVWNVQNENSIEMNNFVVFVSDNPFSSKDLGVTFSQQGVTAYTIAGEAGYPSALSIDRTGRYVRVQFNNKTGFIILGEVEVLGCPPTDDCPNVGQDCDDGNPNTINDKINENCICIGIPDTGCQMQGMPCDDRNPNTIDDRYDANCNCVGVPISCNQPVNIALNKNAIQDGTQNNQLAAYAVDGNTNGVWNALSQTDWKENAWWEVDLAQISDIESINIWNIDGENAAIMKDFYVLVSDDPFVSTALNPSLNQSGVVSFLTSGQAGYPTSINVNETGRYVRVQLNGQGFVTMGEVEVFGCPLLGGASCNVVNKSCDDGNSNTINDTYNAACNCMGTYVQNSCNLMVSNTNNNGSGSLRDAIVCAADGATIQFANHLVNDVVFLTGEVIDINKNLNIIGPNGASVFVNGSYVPRIFKVNSGVQLTLSGIHLVGGTLQDGSIILNKGSVYIDDAYIFNCVSNPNPSNPRLSGNGTYYLTQNVVVQN